MYIGQYVYIPSIKLQGQIISLIRGKNNILYEVRVDNYSYFYTTTDLVAV